ncbi:MAG: hypothetical protein WD403_11070 [Pirellulales bacterium]
MPEPKKPHDDDPIFADPQPARRVPDGPPPSRPANEPGPAPPEPAQDAEHPAQKGSPGTSARLKERAGPYWEQAWLNLRVWAPALANPHFRARLIKYRPSENRTALQWQVVLPRQCCQCGAAENLRSRAFRRDVRTFETPITLLTGTWGLAAFLLFVWLVLGWSWPLHFGRILLLIGPGLLWLKSWKEEVRVSMWACPAHFDGVSAPGLVIHDDELFIQVPSSSLAETAKAELVAARRQRRHYPEAVAGAPQPSPAASRPPPAGEKQGGPPSTEPAPFVPPPRGELPPIKLAGDEDESRP